MTISTEREVIEWCDRAWRTAVRERWEWDGYYYHLVAVSLNALLERFFRATS